MNEMNSIDYNLDILAEYEIMCIWDTPSVRVREQSGTYSYSVEGKSDNVKFMFKIKSPKTP